MRRIALSIFVPIVIVVVSACGGAAKGDPTPPPPTDTAPAIAVPAGPVLYEPEQIVLPPEDFPIKDAPVARDAPIATHGWERQFATESSPDFRWFTVRVFVMDADVPASTFVKDNACGSVTWPDERPLADKLTAPNAGDASLACLYTFKDGMRVLYLTTGYRNVGLLVGTQPRRDIVSNSLAVEWTAAIARLQISIIEKVLAAQTTLRAAQRSAIGTHVLPTGPVYSDSGRMSRLSACCSMMCAHHPAIRPSEKMDVPRSAGMPRYV